MSNFSANNNIWNKIRKKCEFKYFTLIIISTFFKKKSFNSIIFFKTMYYVEIVCSNSSGSCLGILIFSTHHAVCYSNMYNIIIMCRCVLNLPLKHSCTFQTFLSWKLISKVPIYEVKTLRGLTDEKAYISNVKLNWLVIIKCCGKRLFMVLHCIYLCFSFEERYDYMKYNKKN